MNIRGEWVFTPVASTAPSFSATFDNTSTNFALESTALGRVWQGPGGRSIRVANSGADDFHMNMGSSTIVAASSDSILMLSGSVEVFHPLTPSVTYIAFVSSTDVTANVTIGYGM